MSEKKIHKKHYESRVRWKAIVIYIVATLICAGMIYYIYTLKKSILNQRVAIHQNEHVLDLTNDLIQKVNEAQSYAQFYTISGDENYLNDFNENLKIITGIKDSLIFYSKNDTINTRILDDIISLMKRKAKIIKKINHQYEIFNPYEEIYKLISDYKPEKKTRIIEVTNTDTIIHKAGKQSFFRRIFSSETPRDSIIFVTTTTYDTITEESDNKIDIMKDVKIYTDKGRQEYLKRLETIEKQYQIFIESDQKITEEVSVLLIALHKQTLTSVMNEIQKSESIIQRNMNFSIYGGALALVFILLFIILIFNDVQKVAKAKKATEEAQRRTEEIMESRHKLLLSVSHDIKAPLASIVGYIELMQMERQDENDMKRLNSMKYSSQHILSLLSNLLEFSSLDQGKQSITHDDFNVAELCDRLAEMFKPIAENKQLRFFYHRTIPDDISVNSDALKIKQVVSNIISNALKYTIEGDVHFGAYLEDNRLIFSVIDQGIGIPQDKIDDMFKPFSKAENNKGVAEGNGFGLYVVKGLLELLDGDIRVMSEIEKGSHFEISIPVKVTTSKVPEKRDDIDIQLVKSKKQLNILLIDDDNSLLAVICAMLSKIGHRSDICRSSSEFNKILADIGKYDLVITDREMGTFSGNDVLKTIKSIDKDKKIILMTARDEYSEQYALSEGFDGYIKKPFSINELASILGDKFTDEKRSECEFSGDFPQLCAMFDNDGNAIRDILNSFVDSTSDNLVLLNDAIIEHDFERARAVCHKMRPMFVQLELEAAAAYLTAMDGCRGEGASPLPEWEERGVAFMAQADEVLGTLGERYGIV